MRSGGSFVRTPGLPSAKETSQFGSISPALYTDTQKFDCTIKYQLRDAAIGQHNFLGFERINDLRQAVYNWRRGQDRERDQGWHELSLITSTLVTNVASGQTHRLQVDLDTGQVVRVINV